MTDCNYGWLYEQVPCLHPRERGVLARVRSRIPFAVLEQTCAALDCLSVRPCALTADHVRPCAMTTCCMHRWRWADRCRVSAARRFSSDLDDDRGARRRRGEWPNRLRRCIADYCHIYTHRAYYMKVQHMHMSVVIGDVYGGDAILVWQDGQYVNCYA